MTTLGIDTRRYFSTLFIAFLLLVAAGCRDADTMDPVAANVANLSEVLVLIEDDTTDPESMVAALESAAEERAGDVAEAMRAVEVLGPRGAALLEEAHSDELIDVLHRLVAAHKRNLWRLRQQPALLVRYRAALARLAPALRGAS